jgi:hypothetical protein
LKEGEGSSVDQRLEVGGWRRRRRRNGLRDAKGERRVEEISLSFL